jgi:iron-sulfur cluster assembly protein
LGLALDEPKDNDEVVDQEGLKFLVEKGLLVTCGEILVDFMEAGPRSGFSITSKVPLASGGGGCSSGSCSSGSCG